MPEPKILDIKRLGAQGDGIAEQPDGPIYVPFALPGEKWQHHPDGTNARLTAAPERVEPPCPHFQSCGGCVAQHMSASLYSEWKTGLVRQALSQQGNPCPDAPIWQPAPRSRRRVVHTADIGANEVRLGFRAPGSHSLVHIDECTIADPQITNALSLLVELLETAASAMPAKSTFKEARVYVLAAKNGLDVLIEVDAPDPSAETRAALAGLADTGGLLRLRFGGSEIYQRATPSLSIGGIAVPVSAETFVQAVSEAETHMAKLVTKALRPSKRVADLFSGLGAFSLPLAKRSRVLAVDSDANAISALDQAVRHAQGLKPVETLRRDLFREPLSRGELNAFDGVVFDPPRAGAAAQSAALAKSKVPTIVAVSCNPATMSRDLKTLLEGGYKVASVNPVDQFLYSAHVEVVAVLRR